MLLTRLPYKTKIIDKKLCDFMSQPDTQQSISDDGSPIDYRDFNTKHQALCGIICVNVISSLT